MDQPTAFGEELRLLRAERGMSLRDLAKLPFISKTVVWEWKTGRKHPDLETAARLDEVLNAGGTLITVATSRVEPIPAGTDVDRLGRLRGAVDRIARKLGL